MVACVRTTFLLRKQTFHCVCRLPFAGTSPLFLCAAFCLPRPLSLDACVASLLNVLWVVRIHRCGDVALRLRSGPLEYILRWDCRVVWSSYFKFSEDPPERFPRWRYHFTFRVHTGSSFSKPCPHACSVPGLSRSPYQSLLRHEVMSHSSLNVRFSDDS